MDYGLTLTAYAKGGGKTQELEPLSLSWAGDWRDCARTLDYTVRDDSITDLGGAVELARDGALLMRAYVVSRTRNVAGHTITAHCVDRGFWLNRNSTSIAVRELTPEAVAAQLAGEFGIPTGSVAAAGIPITRNFINVPVYRIIQTMYTLASEQTGKKYMIRFNGDAMDVLEKTAGKAVMCLETGVNITDATAGDSIERMVNAVAVYDKDAKKTATFADAALQADYGILQQAISANDREDPAAQAKDILAEHGLKTTVAASCLGSHKLITGTAVAVHEPVSGTDGLFWIQSDRHTVQSGLWTTDVDLEFKNLMSKEEAGSLPKE